MKKEKRFSIKRKIYRIGGDEFVAILLGPDFENRIEITNRLKAEWRKPEMIC